MTLVKGRKTVAEGCRESANILIRQAGDFFFLYSN